MAGSRDDIPDLVYSSAESGDDEGLEDVPAAKGTGTKTPSIQELHRGLREAMKKCNYERVTRHLILQLFAPILFDTIAPERKQWAAYVKKNAISLQRPGTPYVADADERVKFLHRYFEAIIKYLNPSTANLTGRCAEILSKLDPLRAEPAKVEVTMCTLKLDLKEVVPFDLCSERSPYTRREMSCILTYSIALYIFELHVAYNDSSFIATFEAKCEEESKAVESIKSNGNKEYKEKNYTKAVMFYGSAISKSKFNHILYSNRAQAYYKLRQPFNAAMDGWRVIMLRPEWYRGHLRLGYAYCDLEKLDAADVSRKKGLACCYEEREKQDFKGLEEKIKEITKKQAARVKQEEKKAAKSDSVLKERKRMPYPNEIYDRKHDLRSKDDHHDEPPPLVSSDDEDHFDKDGPPGLVSSEEDDDDDEIPLKANMKAPEMQKTSEGATQMPTKSGKKSSEAAKTEKVGTTSASDERKSSRTERSKREDSLSKETAEKNSSGKPDCWIEYQRERSSGTDSMHSNTALAVKHYMNALEMCKGLVQEGLIKESEHVVLLYSAATASIQTHVQQDVKRGLKMMTEIISKFSQIKFPLAYLGLGRGMLAQNRFDEAKVKLKLALEKKKYVRPLCWPGSDEIIEESQPPKFEECVKDSLHKCDFHPAPVANCQFKECSGHYKRQMYADDLDFKGYVRVLCHDKCQLDYHRDCWKKYKSLGSEKLSEKDLHEGQPCLTPDCGAQVCKIQIFGAGGNVEKVLNGKEPEKTEKVKKPIIKMVPSSAKTITKRAEKKKRKKEHKQRAQETVVEEKTTENKKEDEEEKENRSGVEPPSLGNLENCTILRKKDRIGDEGLFKRTKEPGKNRNKRKEKHVNVLSLDDLKAQSLPAVVPPQHASMGLDDFTQSSGSPVHYPVLDSINPFTIPNEIRDDVELFEAAYLGGSQPQSTPAPAPAPAPVAPVTTPRMRTYSDLEEFNIDEFTGMLDASELSGGNTPAAGLYSGDLMPPLAGPVPHVAGIPQVRDASPAPASGVYSIHASRSNVSVTSNSSMTGLDGFGMADLDDLTAELVDHSALLAVKPQSGDAISIKDAVFSLFADLLADGPLHVSDAKVLDRMAQVSCESMAAIEAAGGIASFLQQSMIFYVVDDVVCLMKDISQAQRLARKYKSGELSHPTGNKVAPSVSLHDAAGVIKKPVQGEKPGSTPSTLAPLQANDTAKEKPVFSQFEAMRNTEQSSKRDIKTNSPQDVSHGNNSDPKAKRSHLFSETNDGDESSLSENEDGGQLPQHMKLPARYLDQNADWPGAKSLDIDYDDGGQSDFTDEESDTESDADFETASSIYSDPGDDADSHQNTDYDDDTASMKAQCRMVLTRSRSVSQSDSLGSETHSAKEDCRAKVTLPETVEKNNTDESTSAKTAEKRIYSVDEHPAQLLSNVQENLPSTAPSKRERLAAIVKYALQYEPAGQEEAESDVDSGSSISDFDQNDHLDDFASDVSKDQNDHQDLTKEEPHMVEPTQDSSQKSDLAPENGTESVADSSEKLADTGAQGVKIDGTSTRQLSSDGPVEEGGELSEATSEEFTAFTAEMTIDSQSDDAHGGEVIGNDIGLSSVTKDTSKVLGAAQVSACDSPSSQQDKDDPSVQTDTVLGSSSSVVAAVGDTHSSKSMAKCNPCDLLSSKHFREFAGYIELYEKYDAMDRKFIEDLAESVYRGMIDEYGFEDQPDLLQNIVQDIEMDLELSRRPQQKPAKEEDGRIRLMMRHIESAKRKTYEHLMKVERKTTDGSQTCPNMEGTESGGDGMNSSADSKPSSEKHASERVDEKSGPVGGEKVENRACESCEELRKTNKEMLQSQEHLCEQMTDMEQKYQQHGKLLKTLEVQMGNYIQTINDKDAQIAKYEEKGERFKKETNRLKEETQNHLAKKKELQAQVKSLNISLNEKDIVIKELRRTSEAERKKAAEKTKTLRAEVTQQLGKDHARQIEKYEKQLSQMRTNLNEERDRALNGEVKCLELQRTIDNDHFLTNLRDIQVQTVQYNKFAKNCSTRHVAIPARVSDVYTQWSRVYDKIDTIRLSHWESYEQQIRMIRDGLRLSSLPILRRPSLPSFPDQKVDEALKSLAQNGSSTPSLVQDRRTPSPQQTPTKRAEPLQAKTPAKTTYSTGTAWSSVAGAGSGGGNGASTSNAYIIDTLSKLFPIYTKMEFNILIHEVRRDLGGQLTGVSRDQIITLVAEKILEEQNEDSGGAAASPMQTQRQRPQPSSSPALEDPCVICHDELQRSNMTTLRCGHGFHSHCIRTWLRKQSTCPNCRVHALFPDDFPALG